MLQLIEENRQDDVSSAEENPDSPFWPDTKRLLERGMVTPVIGNFAIYKLIGDMQGIAQAWAKNIQSPLSEDHNRDLARVAQFYSIQESNREAKRHYLATLKDFLVQGAALDEKTDKKLLKMLQHQDKYKDHTFSELADRLGYPRYPSLEENPFRLLAELPLSVYLTTSSHNFLEVALGQNSRKAKPVSEIYQWREGLEHLPSIYDTEPKYEPSLERPLVYHLYGLDSFPESLVFTEDDYLDFLVNVTHEASEVRTSSQTDVGHSLPRRQLPSTVIQALSTPLVMLGYDIYTWEFRALLKGLIQPRSRNWVDRGFSVQIKPTSDDNSAADEQIDQKIKEYLIDYFKQSKFDLYWGTPEECALDLYKTL
ncbi:MAG: SIR2 family protein [Chloroflexota bacterium]